MNKPEEVWNANSNWVTWIEKERAIKEAKEAIIKSEMSNNPIQGFTFPELNQIWVAKNRIISILAQQYKTNRSLDAINDTIFSVYLWILKFISFVPFISLGIIGYNVISNFSMWNLFVGLLWQAGVVISARVLSWLLIFIVGYGFNKVEAKNRVLDGYSLKEWERVTHKITPKSGLIYCYCNGKFLLNHSIRHMYEESQKRKEDEMLTFEEKTLKLAEVLATEFKIANVKFRKELQMINRFSKKRNINNETYLELVSDLVYKASENKHYKLIFDTDSLRLKDN